MRKALAAGAFALLWLGCIGVVGSGLGRGASWQSIDHTMLFVGAGCFAAGLRVAIVAKWTIPGWRGEDELGAHNHRKLLLGSFAAVGVGLGIAAIRAFAR